MNYLWATGTHQGLVRSSNQDTVHPPQGGRSSEGLVVAVADGMGGHVAGEVASEKAMAAAVAAEGAEPTDRVRAANEAVILAAVEDRRLAGMGTTLTIADLDGEGMLRIGHVGDSRAYLLRAGTMRQLTRDHSVVAEYLAAGKIRPEDVETHPARSMLTRALGMQPEVEVDLYEERLAPGDRLLLCSDGLNGMVPDDTIRDLLGDGAPEEAVWALIEAANRAGGIDNITVAVVDVTP